MPSKLPRVIARVSPAARRRIEEEAARAGLRVSRWARQVLLRAIETKDNEPTAVDEGRRRVLITVDLDDGDVRVVRDSEGE